MSQVQIAWVEFILVGGLGVTLTLSGMMVHIVVAQRTNMLCTKQTEGIVTIMLSLIVFILIQI